MKLSSLIVLSAAIFLLSCSAVNKKDISVNNAANVPATQNMAEDKFWQLIDNSISESKDNYQVQIVSLKQILSKLSAPEIVQFNNTFYELMNSANDYKLWGAAYVINGDCADDDFEYFREYLIAHGKEKFYQTIKDPESCAPWMKTEEDDNWDGILSSAEGAYKIVTEKEIPAPDVATTEIKGEKFDEETVEKDYPVLAKKFQE